MKLWSFALGISLAAAQAQSLQLGKVIEAPLAKEASDRYSISLAQDQYLAIKLEPRKLRLSATLTDPDGNPVLTVKNTAVLEEPIIFSTIATTPGAYSLSLSRVDDGAATSYALSIVELHPATAADRRRIEAEAAYRSGLQIMVQDTRETRMAALEKYLRARDLWREAGDSANEERVLRRIGWVYFRIGDSRKAIEIYEQLLALSREIHDRTFEGETLNNMGLEYANLGEHAQALTYLEQALVVQREIRHPRVSSVISNIAYVYEQMGETPKALEYSREALQLRRETGDRAGEAATLSIMAGAYRAQGEFQQALNTFQDAMDLWRSIGDEQREALALGNIGALYLDLKDPELALERLERALAIKRKAGDRPGEGTTLSQIGVAYIELRQPKRAIDFYTQALAIGRELGDRGHQAAYLNLLAEAFVQLGQSETSMQYYTDARALANSAGIRFEESRALAGISNLYLRQHQPANALELAQEALSVLRAGAIRDGQQNVLTVLAKARAESGDLPGAREDLQTAIGLAESIRASVAGAEFRASYFAGTHEEYELLIDVLMRLHKQFPERGYAAEAFAVSERARARSLLELLGESREDIREGVDPALLEREKALRAALNVKARAPERDSENLVLQYRELQNQIRVKSPRYAALTMPQPLSLAEIQSDLLDPDALLLEFALGEERSYVFRVVADTVSGYELPSRAVIESSARRLYAAFSGNDGVGGAQEIRTMSRMLLAPLAGKLDRKRLVVVCEGALQYIPFVALNDVAGKPLLVQHEIVGLPSASTLLVLRKELSGRVAAPKTLIAFGDPVFAPDDPRVHGSPAASPPPAPASSALQRSAKNSGIDHFYRLPGTRKEVESITALAGASRVRRALDFEASREAALSPEISQYRMIHFATHGLLNNRNPDFSGLVLSLVSPGGNQIDGFLRAGDIYNLRLSADLVTLSACETALGEDITGEGIVGLTRSFMYAGAPRVVASLWNVPDKAGAELMERFYRGMLVNRLTPAAALRAAQAALRNNPRTATPFYWAGFVLQGEWR